MKAQIVLYTLRGDNHSNQLNVVLLLIVPKK